MRSQDFLHVARQFFWKGTVLYYIWWLFFLMFSCFNVVPVNSSHSKFGSCSKVCVPCSNVQKTPYLSCFVLL